jgi:hypothetical protein
MPNISSQLLILISVMALVLLSLHLKFSFRKIWKYIFQFFQDVTQLKLSRTTFTCSFLTVYSFAFALFFMREAFKIHKTEEEIYCCIEDYIWNVWDYLSSTAFLFCVGCLFAAFRSFIQDNRQQDVPHITPSD